MSTSLQQMERQRAHKESKNHLHSRPGKARGGNGFCVKPETCRHFLKGCCTRNPCRYSHSPVSDKSNSGASTTRSTTEEISSSNGLSELITVCDSASTTANCADLGTVVVDAPSDDLGLFFLTGEEIVSTTQGRTDDSDAVINSGNSDEPSGGEGHARQPGGGDDDSVVTLPGIDVSDTSVVELRSKGLTFPVSWKFTISSAAGLVAGTAASCVKFFSRSETSWRRAIYAGWKYIPGDFHVKVVRWLHGWPKPFSDPYVIGAASAALACCAYELVRAQFMVGDTIEAHKQMVVLPSYVRSPIGALFGYGLQNREQMRDFQLRRGLDHYAQVVVHNGLVEFLVKRYRGSNIEAHLPRSWYRTITEYTDVLGVRLVDDSVRYAHQLLHSAHAQDVACGLVVVKPMPVGRPN